MKVSLYTRVSSGAKRRYVPVNRNKIYREGTVFCLRYARRWETLTADNLNAALAARATKEAALLTEESPTAEAAAKRIGIDDAISAHLSNTAATKKHRTLLAYTRANPELSRRHGRKGLDRARPVHSFRFRTHWANAGRARASRAVPHLVSNTLIPPKPVVPNPIQAPIETVESAVSNCLILNLLRAGR